MDFGIVPVVGNLYNLTFGFFWYSAKCWNLIWIWSTQL